MASSVVHLNLEVQKEMVGELSNEERPERVERTQRRYCGLVGEKKSLKRRAVV